MACNSNGCGCSAGSANQITLEGLYGSVTSGNIGLCNNFPAYISYPIYPTQDNGDSCGCNSGNNSSCGCSCECNSGCGCGGNNSGCGCSNNCTWKWVCTCND